MLIARQDEKNKKDDRKAHAGQRELEQKYIKEIYQESNLKILDHNNHINNSILNNNHK